MKIGRLTLNPVLENIEIRSFNNDDLKDFTKMFCTYFRSDFSIEITDDQVEELCSKIADNSNLGVTPLDVLMHDGKMAGFICYQIDSKKSDWCEREGWGFIREIHINPSLRGNGLGSILVAHVEEILFNKGAQNIYLTSDKTGEFWRLCGYTKTDKVSSFNNDPIYEK